MLGSQVYIISWKLLHFDHGSLKSGKCHNSGSILKDEIFCVCQKKKDQKEQCPLNWDKFCQIKTVIWTLHGLMQDFVMYFIHFLRKFMSSRSLQMYHIFLVHLYCEICCKSPYNIRFASRKVIKDIWFWSISICVNIFVGNWETESFVMCVSSNL